MQIERIDAGLVWSNGTNIPEGNQWLMAKQTLELFLLNFISHQSRRAVLVLEPQMGFCPPDFFHETAQIYLDIVSI